MHPYLLHFGHFALPTFGVLAAVGLMLALTLSLRTARLAHLEPDRVWDAGLFAILAAFGLSRLLLVLMQPRTFLAYPVLLLAVPSLTATGLLLTVIATAGWLWYRGLSWRRVLDAWAPCATLVWAFLALGHFAEGSDPGVMFHGDPGRFWPVALLACAAALLLTIALDRMLARGVRVAGTAAMAVGAVQFLLSFLRQPGVAGPLGLDVLQWVSLGIMAVGGVLLIER